MRRADERRPSTEWEVDRIQALLEPDTDVDGLDGAATKEAYDRVIERISHGETVTLGSRAGPVAESRKAVRRPRLAVVATSVAVTVMGVLTVSITVGTDPTSSPPSEELPAADTDRGMSEDELSAELIQLTDPSANRTLHDAAELLRVECMRDAGFERWVEPHDGSHPFTGTTVHREHRLFQLTEEQAAQAGVSHPRGDLDLGTTDGRGDPSSPNTQYVASLSPDQAERYHTAMYGTPDEGDHVVVEHPDGAGIGVATNGCSAQAHITLFGDLATYLEVAYIARNLEHLAMTHITDTDDHVADWRTCMRDEGYPDLDSPQYVATFEATADEQRVADTHVTCLSESGLRQAFPDLLARAMDEMAARYENELIAFSRIERRALDTAEQILENPDQ